MEHKGMRHFACSAPIYFIWQDLGSPRDSCSNWLSGAEFVHLF